jgi:hypothetical protein
MRIFGHTISHRLPHLRIFLLLFLGSLGMNAAAAGWNDSSDPVAITTDAVANKRLPVLRVVHEAGPGGWQFYDDSEPLGEPVVLPKESILLLDPSLVEITDLPTGWEAVRSAPSGKWNRAKIQE